MPPGAGSTSGENGSGCGDPSRILPKPCKFGQEAVLLPCRWVLPKYASSSVKLASFFCFDGTGVITRPPIGNTPLISSQPEFDLLAVSEAKRNSPEGPGSLVFRAKRHIGYSDRSHTPPECVVIFYRYHFFGGLMNTTMKTTVVRGPLKAETPPCDSCKKLLAWPCLYTCCITGIQSAKK